MAEIHVRHFPIKNGKIVNTRLKLPRTRWGFYLSCLSVPVRHQVYLWKPTLWPWPVIGQARRSYSRSNYTRLGKTLHTDSPARNQPRHFSQQNSLPNSFYRRTFFGCGLLCRPPKKYLCTYTLHDLFHIVFEMYGGCVHVWWAFGGTSSYFTVCWIGHDELCQ